MTTERRGGQGAGRVQPLQPSGQCPVSWTSRLVSSLQSPGRGWGQNQDGGPPGLAQRQLPKGWGALRLLLLPRTLSTFRAPSPARRGELP